MGAAGTQNPPKDWIWKYQYLCWGNKIQGAPGSTCREVEAGGGRVSLGRAAPCFFPPGHLRLWYSGSATALN